MFEQLDYFIRERESIRIKKTQGLPPPWTDNEKLATYRFCNIRRIDDAVSQWIYNNLLIPYKDHEYFPVIASLGRWINRPQTLQGLISNGFIAPGWSLDLPEIRDYLDTLEPPVFDAAYVIPNAGVKTPKTNFVCCYALSQVQDRLIECKAHLTSMRKASIWFASLNGWAGFMSNQVVCDMSYVIDFPDKMDFCLPGPGTLRGMERLFGKPAPKERQQAALMFIRKHILNTHSIHLSLADVGNVMCEYDKFVRPNPPKQTYKPRSMA